MSLVALLLTMQADIPRVLAARASKPPRFFGHEPSCDGRGDDPFPECQTEFTGKEMLFADLATATGHGSFRRMVSV